MIFQPLMLASHKTELITKWQNSLFGRPKAHNQ